MEKKRLIYNILAPVVGCVAFIAVWFIVSAAIGKSIILPSPADTLSSFFVLLGEGQFYLAIGRTLCRTLLSFVIAFALGCVFAFLSVKSEFFKKAFSPVAVIVRVLPTISIILLVLIWFRSATAPYVITFIVIFPMLYTTILNAAENVDSKLVEMCQAYHVSKGRQLFCLYIPEMTSAVLTGMSITLSFSVKLTIAAEVLASTQGSMGRYMSQSSAYIDTPTLLAWTLAAILLGFILEGLVLLVKKLLLRRYRGR